MAGDEHGGGIGGAGVGDGADGFGATDGFRDLFIGARLAIRDRAQGGPDARLKGGGADVQREIQPGFVAVEVAEDGARPGL